MNPALFNGEAIPRLLIRLKAHLHEVDRQALMDSCEDEGCVMHLDLPNVCISGERSRLLDDPHGRKADFVIATQETDHSGFVWLVTEMKAGSADPGELRDQIQAGMAIVRNCASHAPGNATIIPVALLGLKGQRVAPLLVNDRYRVEVRGRRHAIFPGKCGDSLSAIIRASGSVSQSARSSKRSRRR